MKQFLHIFLKDVRRFRLEILVSLFLLVLSAWIWPGVWRNALVFQRRSSFGIMRNFGLGETLLALLIPLSWGLLITRAVHEERLVGDRQFWITRPYEWKKLLAAKVLLIVCFVYLPLAACQWWLLAGAGLHPASHIGALLYNWLLLTALPILPIAALAAVTRNFARMVLTLLGLFVAAATIAGIISALLQSGALHSPVDNITVLYLPLILFFCLATVLLAYARRNIAAGRILLLALPVLLLVSTAFFSSDAVLNHDYPEIGSAGVRFSLQANAQNLKFVHVAINPQQLFIQIPLHADGIAPGELWVGKGVRVTIKVAGQTLWVSPWQRLNFYLPASSDVPVYFNVDRTVYDRVESEPVTLHLEVALGQARREQVVASQISLRDIEVPRLGVCSSIVDPEHPEMINGRPTPAINGLSCRSVLHNPQLTYVEAALMRGPCQGEPETGHPQVQVQGTWIGDLKRDPAESAIAPVKVVPVSFSNNWFYNGTDRFVEFTRLCPGAPVTFTRYGLVRQLRTELTIEGFQFPSYDKREDEAR